MAPLIAIAASVLPQILTSVLGDKTGKAAGTVAKIVTETLGTSEVEQVKAALADPATSDQLRAKLLDFTIEQDRINLENTVNARDMQRDLASMRSPVAWIAPTLSLIVTVGFFLMLFLFIIFKGELEQLPAPNLPDLAILNQLDAAQIAALVRPTDFVIQIINIAVGALAAAFATVISFWLGSSSGSQSKDKLFAQLQTEQAATQNTMVERATTVVTGTPPPGEPGPAGFGPESPTGPAGGGTGPGVKPAAHGLLGEVLPELTAPHRKFPGSVQWALAPGGIVIDGAAAAGTAGEPKSVAKFWKQFGSDCASAAQRYGVPVELIIATIATESRGDPTARRDEPQINDASIGLMQTLVSTAREATGRPGLRANDLLDPRTSIDAGTAYIAGQRGTTHFDPPLVAAAYNAGSLKRDDADKNRWKLHCFPKGTGAHVDRFVEWFADCMVVSARDGWGKNGVPSFAAALAPAGAAAAVADPSDPNFPLRPDFDPVVRTEERQALFGRFDFEPDPRPDNKENIKIKGTWERDNIVDVEIPLQAGPRRMRFHRLAADQLKNLWLEWEAAGLLDRLETFDGAYVPRFIRGSTQTLSNHAFGTAFDINAAFNGLKQKPAAVGEKGCVREMVEIANKHGFYWGGHFRDRLDGMHFEIAKIIPT